MLLLSSNTAQETDPHHLPWEHRVGQGKVFFNMDLTSAKGWYRSLFSDTINPMVPHAIIGLFLNNTGNTALPISHLWGHFCDFNRTTSLLQEAFSTPSFHLPWRPFCLVTVVMMIFSGPWTRFMDLKRSPSPRQVGTEEAIQDRCP